ncbi:DprA-like DNA processing chain A [Gordonia phage Kampe]|uniref:DprA-like DNA processing chain A n=3 Tax=Gordonia phage Orchid TaxID=1838075 RepID=A0A166YGH5_9CAUD|nr:DprA-like DNA processing chain A [Gordonia phage Orchid]ANA87300.1 DprA-like DNA processing chain A [Gordonia phage PatrickStar]ANA87412.1 DprA-like DNA processing chain A [Gordonia phage Orchid]ANA87527.1 DprA-like DNA processing chain A [Gordonia phage Kampe]
MKKILVTGSRNWTSSTLIYSAITDCIDVSKPLDYLIIEGENPRGADIIARGIAWGLGIPVLGVRAEWEKYGNRAGMIRNLAMIEMKPDIVLAFPLEDSRGTIHCMNAARKAGIQVIDYGPWPHTHGMESLL